MILVDALRWRLDPRTLRRKRWAYMIATEGLAELHAAALSLGLRREWAQDVHYEPCPASECRAGGYTPSTTSTTDLMSPAPARPV